MITEVFTTGFPRTGSNWLGRLLSDLLNAPQQTMPERAIVKEFAETIDLPPKYIIRRTHWYRDQWDDMNGVGYLGGPAKIIWITRDPRDMVVSMMNYRKSTDLMATIRSINNGGKRAQQGKPGGFVDFVDGWLRKRPHTVSYEDLHEYPILTLDLMVYHITGKHPGSDKIKRVVERQKFDNWKEKYPHAMHKGTTGQWRYHFTREAAELMDSLYWREIIDLGYERDRSWVLEVN